VTAALAEAIEVLVGIMTDFKQAGGRHPFGGAATLTTDDRSFRAPRVEGEFSGGSRAFDTLWGPGDAHIAVEDGFVESQRPSVERLRDAIRRAVLARLP
jgi:hypothetical protein